MNTLISPDEVIEIAFAGCEPIDKSAIDISLIMTAEQKFIRPVVGKLYDSLLEGKYPEFVCEQIKAPLALYVKFLALALLSFRIGNMGVGQQRTDSFEPCSPAEQTRLAANIRTSATALIRRAVDHIESAPERYPEYDRSENVLHKVRIDGGIIL